MKGRMIILALLALCLCVPAAAGAEESAFYVRKVENLPEDFIFGMDVSSVLAEEASGVKYYDFDGNETDLFRILADNGINYIRVRVWNDPYDEEGRGFGGGNCDIRTAVEIGKRATACGMKLLVDFHYSDFWADPGKQMVPRAWAGMGIEEKTEAARVYVLDCMRQLKEAGVDVGMVQLGNETNGWICGESDWQNIALLMDAGAKSVREVCPDALIAVHFANPENPDSYRFYADKLAKAEQDGLIGYDVFASSYYPYWHGTLDNLSAILTEIASTYGKKVMVMETSYAYTDEDTDFSGNTIGKGGEAEGYPFSPQGQADCVRDITDAVVNRMENGIGVCYWEGAWITVGTNSWEENHEKWEKYGSGWASSYAAAYDPEDAGQWYGGCAVDNQTFFDAEGKPLESLKVFRLMRTGYGTPPAAQEKPAAAEEPAEAKEAAPAKHNYVSDFSFEGGGEAWTVTDLKHADELYVENKPTDSLTGVKHLHFWSAAQDSVEFTAEQTIRDLPEGRFSFRISVMGGDCGATDIYAYVKIDGQETARSEQIPITGWKNWNAGEIPEFDHPEGTEVTVGIYVKCQGSGKGAWGKIDDAVLNSVQ